MTLVPVIDFDPARPRVKLGTEIERWMTSEVLLELVSAFDGPALAAEDTLAEWLTKLATFSNMWDFRGGAERNLAATAEFAESQTELILAAADGLGLVSSRRPRFNRYDHLVVLGGLVRACILRPRLAAELVASGTAVRTVTGIGAFRPLAGDEPAIAAAAGLRDVGTEFDAMDAGMRAAFSLAGPHLERGDDVDDNPNLSWRVRELRAPDGLRVTVVAAPTTDPARRANTPDSYRYLAEELIHIAEGERVLAVTSTIYVPFQHADAIRMLGLPYGAVVDTVGVDTTTAREPEVRQMFTPSNYLQEIRSAILSTVRLHDAVLALP